MIGLGYYGTIRRFSGYHQNSGLGGRVLRFLDLEVFGSTIIIGTETGRVLFFKFDLHNLLKVL